MSTDAPKIESVADLLDALAKIGRGGNATVADRPGDGTHAPPETFEQAITNVKRLLAKLETRIAGRDAANTMNGA